MAATMERVSGPWPLTGRHEAIDAACDALAAGCPAYVLIGEAGTGKTRLAREILARLERDGIATARVTATESARLTPLAALAHLVPPGASNDPSTLFRATCDALGQFGDGRPVVIHLDDAHHLDPSSAALLLPLADAGAAQFVVTLREGMTAPDAVAALQAADRAQTVVVDCLDAIAVDTLLHRVLGAPLDGAAEAQLLETSGGNPLFLRELVVGAVNGGTLKNVEGVWRLDGALPTSRALGERVLGRMESLVAASREALEIVAVAEPIGLDDLERLVDPAVLEDLEARGLVRVDVDGRRNDVRLAHPAYGEVLRADLGRVRRRRIARDQAERVASHGARRRDDALRIAQWQIDAGITPDTQVVLAGARLARHNHDWISTAALAGAAYRAGELSAASMIAEAHFEMGEFAEADALINDALAKGPIDDTDLSFLWRMQAITRFWGFDDVDGALAIYDHALAHLPDGFPRELHEFSRASITAWSGRVAEALAVAEPLLESTETRVAVQAALIIELVASAAGPTGRAIELADTYFPVHLGLPDLAGTTNPGNHLVTKAVALTQAGRLDESHALAEFGYGASVANRSSIGQAWFSLELGRIALMRGDAVAAERWFREMIALCHSTGHRRPITLGLAGLAIACAYRDDADGARAAVAEMDAVPSAHIPLVAIESARARGWAAAASGDLPNARAAIVEGAEAAEALGIALGAALARFDALRLGDRSQASALRAAAEIVDSRVVELAADWAAAPDDATALAAVSEGFERIGSLMFAAEASAAAATSARKAGDTRRATALEQRADQLARRCQATTPALTTVDSVVPLTPREREIALLVAQGLSSKEVAERLFVSARTVSNHLQNAYVKLGIKRRSELAEALGRFGSDA